MELKRKYIQVTDPDGNVIVYDPNQVDTETMLGSDLEFMPNGAQFTVVVVELTPAEFEAMPEFEG